MSVTTHENQYRSAITINQSRDRHQITYVPVCSCGWDGDAQDKIENADDQLLEHQVQVDREQAVWTPYR